MVRKKVGIITMHNVLNYGSLLQAFSLQEFLVSLGYDAEIIDYKYPNKFHKNFFSKPILYKIFHSCFEFMRKIAYLPIYGGDWKLKSRKFQKHHYRLSKKYNSREEIIKNPPMYDIYITGSDQVWNMDFTSGDDIFMCSFVPVDKTRIAYAASVAREIVPKEYIDIFKANLVNYSAISLRDKRCVNSLESILGKKIDIVCDPVFLQNSEFYLDIAKQSKLNVNEKYLLVYLLDYIFNPFPAVFKIIEQLQNELNIPIYFMWGKGKNALRMHATHFVRVPSVEDFLFLIKNASFVLTNSFHGTALSIIFRRQFYSLVNLSNPDSRLQDLLEVLELSNRLISINDGISSYKEISWVEKESVISKYIRESKQFLVQSLNVKQEDKNSSFTYKPVS